MAPPFQYRCYKRESRVYRFGRYSDIYMRYIFTSFLIHIVSRTKTFLSSDWSVEEIHYYIVKSVLITVISYLWRKFFWLLLINNLIYGSEKRLLDKRRKESRVTELSIVTEITAIWRNRIVQRKGMSQACLRIYRIDIEKSNSHVPRAKSTCHNTLCGIDKHGFSTCPRAEYMHLATAACRETRKSLPHNKSPCELPDCAILNDRNTSADVKPVVRNLGMNWTESTIIVRSRNLIRRLKVNLTHR